MTWLLAQDTLGQEDLDALAEWLQTGPRLTQGPLVRQFEAAWSSWLGVEHSVMVSSGTTANLALTAVAAERVDRPVVRFGVAAVTWATNVTPALLLGHDLVVFDAERRTLGLDEEQVCDAMENGDIDVLFVTHVLGFNSLTSRIIETAERTGTILIEDVCESHGATVSTGRKAGTVGLGSTFSFYFGHHMSTIEGGVVSTPDAGVADALRLFRSHGLARESADPSQHTARHPEIDPAFLFVDAGLNLRSSDLNAFLGLRQLETLDERISHRNVVLDAFLDALEGPVWRDYERSGASSFALPIVAEDAQGYAAIGEVLEREGVETRPLIAGNLLRQPFMERYGDHVTARPTPVADHIHRFGRYVGNGHHVTVEQARSLAHDITAVLTRGATP